MTLSVFKLLLILFIALICFGAGRLPRVMNDIGKSIRALKDGLKEDETPVVVPTADVPPQPLLTEQPQPTDKTS
jgi:sec-independent protein translocase protein TatA